MVLKTQQMDELWDYVLPILQHTAAVMNGQCVYGGVAQRCSILLTKHTTIPPGHHTGHHTGHYTGHHTGHHTGHYTGHYTGHHTGHYTGHHTGHHTGHTLAWSIELLCLVELGLRDEVILKSKLRIKKRWRM